jgi:ArsR family transcriptional regulator
VAKLPTADLAAIKVCKALGHPTRYRIVRMLTEREELGCGDLMAACGISAPALSHHTRILQECGLITVRREGAYHFFRVEPDMLARYAPGLAPSRPAGTH